MNRLKNVFTNRHVVLPVIHVADLEQALRNAEIARQAGADGVFLINHGIVHGILMEIHAKVVSAFADWWVGVNCLGLQPKEVFSGISDQVHGVWVDNAMIREDRDTQPDAEQVLAVRQDCNWTGLYFGGVAFKYQRHVDDLAEAAIAATRYMDVVTTSGPGTGKAALPEKIKTMKQALGDFPLAIASGITPENITSYLPAADCFLVATGISRSFEELEPTRVRELVDVVRSHRAR